MPAITPKLRELLEVHGYTQTQAAKYLGVSQPYVAQLCKAAKIQRNRFAATSASDGPQKITLHIGDRKHDDLSPDRLMRGIAAMYPKEFAEFMAPAHSAQATELRRLLELYKLGQINAKQFAVGLGMTRAEVTALAAQIGLPLPQEVETA
jgi:hypothetical protein